MGCYGLFGSHPFGQKTFLWTEGQRRTFYLRSAGLLSVDCTITRTHLQLGMTHYRGGFFFPSRGAGGSLSLSLSLSLRLRVLQVVPSLHTVVTDLTVVTACLGAADGAASPGGSVPGQPLLGVRTVRGTADHRRLLGLPARLWRPQGVPGPRSFRVHTTHHKSLCSAARRVAALAAARGALRGELRLFPPATRESDGHRNSTGSGCGLLLPVAEQLSPLAGPKVMKGEGCPARRGLSGLPWWAPAGWTASEERVAQSG